jgi:hypothetical protein
MPYRFNPLPSKFDRIQEGGVTPPVETLTGNDAVVVGADAAFNINVLGNNTQGINITGNAGTNTLTITGIDTTTSQKGVVELATSAETTTGTDIARANTPAGLAAKLGVQTLHALPIGAGSTNAFTWTAAPTNGQILIGSTGNDPVLANITSTDGSITVNNGAGTIDLSVGSSADYTGQTIGAVTDDVATIPMGATPGVITFECRIAGFESGTPAGVGYQLFGTVRTNGVAASLVGIPDKVVNEDAALAAADADIVVSGNNAIVRVTGVAGVTINWVVHVENTSTI